MKGKPTLQLLDLNEVVHEVLDLAHSDLIRRKIAITLKLASGLGVVYGGRAQLQQVFLDFIVNACDAMNGNAVIDVTDTGPALPPM